MFVTAAITRELAKDYLTLHAKALKGLLLYKRVHLVNKNFFLEVAQFPDMLFHQGCTELRRCEYFVFVLPVNILTGVARRLLGPHDTLPCVLIITKVMN